MHGIRTATGLISAYENAKKDDNEAFVDIVSEGFHAGVRLGGHIREDMIAVRLSPPTKEVFFAAPAYFDKHGRPERPEGLLRHNCIRYRYISSKRIAEWQFRGAEGITTIDVKGSLIVNSTNASLNDSSSSISGNLLRNG